MDSLAVLDDALRLSDVEDLEASLLILSSPLDGSCSLSNTLEIPSTPKAAVHIGDLGFLDDVPSLDQFLQPEDPVAPCSSVASSHSEWDLDPTVLFPEPVVLQEADEPDQVPAADGASDPADTLSTIGSSSSSPAALGYSSESTASNGAQTPPRFSDLPLPTPTLPRRKRQKDELDCLRVQARGLEKQLAQLKERDADGGDFGRTSPSDSSGANQTGSTWRRVARRQLEGKKRAQRENEKLRNMVEGQLTLVQNLERILRKRSALEEAGLADERKRVRVVNESETAIFAKLMGKLDALYEETDAVLSENGYAHRKIEGDHVQVKPDGTTGMFMEFVSSKILPFGLQTTATEMWRCLARRQFKLRDGHYSVADCTDDTMSAKMSFTINYKQYRVLKDAYFVVKRFVEEHRSVLVWACQTTTEGTLSAAQSMRLSDSGWTVVESFPGDTDEDDQASTIIQSCMRVKTQLPDATPHSPEEVMLLSEILTGSYLYNLDGIHQAVEDRLVEDAMKQTE
ncbi:hypothetical protein BBJ28_00008752 [Nothophytophthora sp. Chile5]|nr:hypothetical protein BBJ28_00008752 [Nothophytophthora sp. Chile5]